MTGSDPKLSTQELLQEAHPALVGLSHWIHANPETGYQETLAAGWVTEWLATAGFEVETGFAGMPTAIIGRSGPGPFHVAVCIEYDALPEVGHACGHNVIAAAGIGAGLALASVADELGLRVSVMGTPAEETGGGKLRFIEAGAFDDVHAAMMVHPWPTDVARPTIIAVNQLEVTYTGKEAHAAGFPQLGRNAADALVIAQTAIGLLRQQLLPTDRVHGIVTKGGEAPNIIPAHTSALYMVRAHDRERLTELIDQVRRCFEAGALATGTQVSVVEGTAYADLIHDPDLSALYRNNAERLGRVFDDSQGAPVSTDMGDVSHMVPTIHPMVGIESQGAVNHQAAFAAACATPSADQAILDGATAMTWTIIDAVQDAVIRARLMGEGLTRQANELAEQAAELELEAEELATAARSSTDTDPGAAEELAVVAAALDTQARDLLAQAEARLDVADALTDAAVRDEVAGELASDADDLRYQAGAMAEAADEFAEDARQDLATAQVLEARAAQLADQAGDVDGNAAEGLSTAAARLQDAAAQLRDSADLRVADAADLAGNAGFVFAASDELEREAESVGGASAPEERAGPDADRPMPAAPDVAPVGSTTTAGDEAAAGGGLSRDDWDAQFQELERGSDAPGEAGEGPAEVPWYTAALGLDGPASGPAPVIDVPAATDATPAVDAATPSSGDPQPPFGDFRWIPGGPDD